jgi:hypothetical protein
VIRQIYENSSLTIVAASVASADRGFLGVRTVPKFPTFKIPCRFSQDQFSIISIQEHEQYGDLKEPVNKRAWTLQEQPLSPQLLIYASYTPQWQCSTTTCNLDDSYHAPSLSAVPKLPAIAQKSEFARKIRDEGNQSTFAETVHLFLQHWMRISISYSNRSVTLESDKLTALAGLATVFSPLLGPDYFAGLWEKIIPAIIVLAINLRYGLLWLSDGVPTSWSWASVDDGPLYFRTYQLNSYRPHRCEFVECQTTLKSQSLPYSEVTGGFLKLRAVLREGQLHASESHQITWQDLSDEQTRAKDSARESGKYWDGARGVSDTAQDNVDGPIVCLPTYMAENVNVGKVDGLMLSTTWRWVSSDA